MKKHSATALTLVTFLASTHAHAHPGHGADSFSTGVLHPFLGWDHLLAMVAVGLWAVQLGGRARWMVPAAFVAAMALGGACGMNGILLPTVEAGVLLSVLTLGVLVAAAVRMPLVVGMGVVGAFALFHGFAHGAEMPVAGSSVAYGFGFTAATMALHLCGVVLGLGLTRATQAPWLRLAGTAICLGGVALSVS